MACEFALQLAAQCIESLQRVLLDRLCVGQQFCGGLGPSPYKTVLQGLHTLVVETKRSEDLIDIVNECLSQSFVLWFVGQGIFEVTLCGIYQLSPYR